MSSGEFRGASEKLQKLEQISTDFVLGRLSRRELLRAGMKLGIGTTALAVTVGRMGLLNGAYADEDIAAKLMEELKLPLTQLTMRRIRRPVRWCPPANTRRPARGRLASATTSRTIPGAPTCCGA